VPRISSEELRRRIAEEVKKGRAVLIHPVATKKFKGKRVAPIDYPR